MTREFREYNQEKREFIEGGKTFGEPTTSENVVKVYDYRNQEDTDTNTSTGNGQVYARTVCLGGTSGDVYYQGVYTEDIEVIDATGTLILKE